jgi:hypothetical protein
MRISYILLLLPVANFSEWFDTWGGVAIIGGTAFFIFVGIPLLMFLGALFETTRIPSYDPVPAEEIPPNPALDAALEEGFLLLSHCTDGDKGIKRGLLSLLLSPDGLVLARILHTRLVRRIELMTRYPDKRWLVTMDKRLPDFSGLDLLDVLSDCPVQTLLQHHQSRVAAMNQPPLPFVPQTAIADARQHFRDRVDEMAKLGIARYTSPDRSKWKHTFKGAMRHFMRCYTEMRQIVSDLKRTKARRQQLEWGMGQNSDQFLVSDPPPFSSHPTTASLPPPAPLPQSSATSQTPSASQAPPSFQSPDNLPPV